MTIAQKTCTDCGIARSVNDFPTREGGKTRSRCTPCFRTYANSKRRKDGPAHDICRLPVNISLVASSQECWVNVVLQVLMDGKFLSNLSTGFDDELLGTDDYIAKLVQREIAHEKSGHLSPGFDRRTSQSRRRLD